MASLTYHEQKDIENIKKLRGLIKELPPFCADFFRGIEPLTSTRTRIAYAYDLRIFFDFLKTSNSQVARMGENIRLSVLEQLTVTDLEEYMEYLKCHPSVNNEDVYNTERGIMRKVSSLKSFYNYFYRNERIEKILPLSCVSPNSMKKRSHGWKLMRWHGFWMRLRKVKSSQKGRNCIMNGQRSGTWPC